MEKMVRILLLTLWLVFFYYTCMIQLFIMLTKKEVLESINSLPAEFEAEDAIEKIVLLEKIHIGLEQSNAGNTLSMSEARERLKKWL